MVSTIGSETVETTRYRRRYHTAAGLVVALGLALVVTAITLIVTGVSSPAAPIGDALWVAVIVTCAARIVLYVRIGASRVPQSLTDTAIMLGLMLLPASWMVLAVAAGVAVAGAFAGQSAGRVAITAAKDAIMVAVAATLGVFLGLDMPYQVNESTLPALALIGVSIIATDEAINIPLLALANGQRVSEVFRRGAVTRIGTAVLRISVAMAVGYLLRSDARLAIATPLAALGVHFYYTNRIQQRADRLSWQRLAKIADEIGSADEPVIHDAAVRGAAAMFSCDEVELEIRLPGCEPRLIRGDANGITYDGPPHVSESYGVIQRATLDTRDGADVGRAGEMRLNFRAPVSFSDREEYTLRALAATVGTAIRKTAAVAEAARMTSRQAQASHHDSLTGLANRAYLVEYAGSAGGRLGLAIVDLNEFRRINDALGQDAGDRALREVACRLASGAQANDLVTRLGGDSFAVLFTDVTSQSDAIARTRALVATLVEPITLDDVRFEIGATAGIAVGPPLGTSTSREGRTAYGVEELLRRADVAVNEAKRDGITIGVFARARDTADAYRLSLSAELRLAVAARQFVVMFQPIVDLATGEIRSAEGLARWQHPEHGSLPPLRFLESIERSGLLAAFTAQILDISLSAARTWREAGFQVPVAVNVSPRSLLDPDFPASVPLALAAHGLPPDALTIELTETLTLSQLEVVDDVLHALSGIGVKLALDDFGTGFSSLAAIARVPVNELKIDRAFVAGMSGTAEGAIVKSTIELGRSLDLLVVAEGVETAEQRERLWAMGCPAGQGHLFGRPMTSETFLAALARGVGGVRGRLADPIHRLSDNGLGADVISLSSRRAAG
jgi:diguanylate cyclase